MAKSVLGRGLGALLGNANAQEPSSPPPRNPPDAAPSTATTGGVRTISVSRIKPCSLQPRKDFDQESLRELANSLRERGILQPLVVRPSGDGFELIAGERRWRAAQLAGLSEVPVIVREADDRTVLELALIENLQRDNLNPIEAAFGYSELMNHFDLTQEEVAERVSKSRAAVANALRLLKLPPDLQSHVRNNRLSVGHAKVLLGLESADEQLLAARRVLEKGLSVRETEELVTRMQQGSRTAPSRRTSGKADTGRNPEIARIEDRLREQFGTRVTVRYRNGKGHVQINFFTNEDFERILEVAGLESE